MRAAAALAGSLVLLATGAPGERRLDLPLRGPSQATVGPQLGLLYRKRGTAIVGVDPHTLRPRRGRRLALPFLDAWAVSPDGERLALAVHPDAIDEANSVRVADVRALRLEPAAVGLGADVSALAWTAPDRVLALVGPVICCPAVLQAVSVDPSAGRVAGREPIAGTVLAIAREPAGLVLLSGPAGAIGPASLTVADPAGVRTAALARIEAGEMPGGTPAGAGISRWRQPGLAVDAAGRHAYVVDPDGPVADVDLRTLAVSYQELRRRGSLLRRLASALVPAAAAKGDEGPVRAAQWLGRGLLLVAGRDLHDTTSRLASDPSGLEVVDTRDWTVRTLAPAADSFVVADGFLLATGTRWRGNASPTGTGLAVYDRDGRARRRLFAGRAVFVDRVARGRAWVSGYGWRRERVVDLAGGRVVGRCDLVGLPEPLLGAGGPWW